MKCIVYAKDNQWWYRGTPLAAVVESLSSIILRINGRDCGMVHSQPGKDGRATHSFYFRVAADRLVWEAQRGQLVTLELVNATGSANVPPQPAAHLVQKVPATNVAARNPQPGPAFTRAEWAASHYPVLCIGLDLAWFGGSGNDRDSQYDCLSHVSIDEKGIGELGLTRVYLGNTATGASDVANCDAAAEAVLTAIRSLVQRHTEHAVVLAIDAPLQALVPPKPPRPIQQQTGQVRRRDCENLLQAACAGYADHWRPNIQPGAPLAQRTVSLLSGLADAGFSIFPAQSKRMVIECFPTEARWAAAACGGFDGVTVQEAKGYKHCDGQRLAVNQYAKYVVDALVGLGLVAGIGGAGWGRVICGLLKILSHDATWIDSRSGCGRGGKLFDDAIDATIALSAATAFVQGAAHVWMHDSAQDGHIIGPGA